MQELPFTVCETGTATLLRGRVTALRDDTVVVASKSDAIEHYPCDVLLSSTDGPPQFELGDEVLMWHSGVKGERGVVVGRIRLDYAAGPHSRETAGSQNELVIEAKKNLILKCGEGSITIREDGKILIKGKDLVSHAQRMNRIKGGSVSIN